MRRLLTAVVVASAVPLAVAAPQTAPALPPAAPAATSKARQPGPSTAQAPTGDFKRLDLWGTVKLASAYYVNPQAVHAVQLAYVFDPREFAAPGTDSKLWRLANDGRITFAVHDTGNSSIRVVAIHDLPDVYKIAGPAQLMAALDSSAISIVADTDLLLGHSATQTLVRRDRLD